jgi:hypothetical protein
MHELRAVCGAFLVAVLTCDLTFDLAVWRAPPGDPIALDRALGNMTHYYRRITANGSLLARSVTIVMTAMLVSLVHELVSGPKAVGLVRFAAESSLAVGPIALAVLRTFPRAHRLATGEGDAATRVEIARSIARDHAVALPAMLGYVVFRLARF